MIKNIIFDLGNVLLRFRPKQLIMNTFENEKTCEVLMDTVFRTPEWLELDKGTMTESEAIQAFVMKAPEYEAEINKIMDIWTHALTPMDAHIHVLENLKSRGYNCYILSNFHKNAYELQRDQHSFFKYFDGGVVSAYVHQLKPDQDIYKSLLSKYELNPAQCLFLDDMKENIIAAQSLGIYGIQVTEEVNLQEEVDRLLIDN